MPTIRPHFVLALAGLMALSCYHAKAQVPANPPLAHQQALEQVREAARKHAEAKLERRTKEVEDEYAKKVPDLRRDDIAIAYEEEYRKHLPGPGLWETIVPQAGWIAAGILFLAAIFRESIRNWLQARVSAVSSYVYESFAGTRLFRHVALRHYRRRLKVDHKFLKVPFRPQRPLDMHKTYVPLTGMKDKERLDLDHLLIGCRRLMVKGVPGSGKSTLLKHLVLAYAEGRLAGLEEQPVAVLLALHRLNDSKLSVAQQLVEELARTDFPKGDRFIATSLERGTLLLLLDGLDEVNSNERPRVVQQLKDVLTAHPKSRAVITCRTQIYRGEFDDHVEQTLEVDQFTDAEMWRFLQAWEPEMPERKSVRHLMHTLRERPTIMGLAHNPLMLTIIAYLYTDRDFTLPRSRAEFYEKSTEILLEQWHQEINKYGLRHKRPVMRQLALLAQDAAAQPGHDRRSIEQATVIHEVRRLLPSVDLDPQKDSEPVLREIVERSGLLLAIDGGERYQFAHLTLQEFFAAEALRDKPNELLARYAKDRDTWREPLKLWCGLANDSTPVIRELRARDALLSLECLADAAKVDPELADEILQECEPLLAIEDYSGSLTQAFGAVASDDRPRGAAVRQLLCDILVKDPIARRREIAAEALARTGLPAAAEMLMHVYIEHFPHSEARAALVRMGDLAVPVLKAGVAGPPLTDAFVEDLRLIGTPDAAVALCSIMHTCIDYSARAAAWQLGALLHQPGVEAALRDLPAKDYSCVAEWLWLWEPFAEPVRSAIPRIVSKIAHLIMTSPNEVPPNPVELDPRLAIPLSCIPDEHLRQLREALSQPLSHQTVEQIAPELSQIAAKLSREELARTRFGRETSPAYWMRVLSTTRYSWREMEQETRWLEQETREAVVQAILPALEASTALSPVVRQLLKSLSLWSRIRLLGSISERLPSQADWRGIKKPVLYEFETGWHANTVLWLVVIVAILAIAQMGIQIWDSPNWLSWTNAALALAVVDVAACLVWSARESRRMRFDFIVILVALGPVMWFAVFSDELRRIKEHKTGFPFDRRYLLLLLNLPWSALVVSFASMFLLDRLDWPWLIGFWLLLISGCALLIYLGKKKEQASRNPLYGLLD